MLHKAADKIRIPALAVAVLAMLASGCSGGGGSTTDSSNKSSGISRGPQQGSRTSAGGASGGGNIAEGDYLRGNWQAGTGTSGANAAQVAPPPAPNVAPPPRSGGSPRAPSPANAASPSAETSESAWALVLATFTEGDTVAAAGQMIAETRNIAPQVQGLRPFPSAKGTMVVYGNYSGREDPVAKRDATWLKSIKYQSRQVFSRVIGPIHLDLRPLDGQLNPYDLHAARQAHPKTNPLYTLDVAMWDDLGAGKMTYDEIRSKAEAYVRQLRTQGFEAYFYHDDVAKRSIVTVGLFDRTAINPISGLYEDSVTSMIKKFPQRLVNGEPMQEFKDKFHPKVGTKPQTPVLVLVPDM